MTDKRKKNLGKYNKIYWETWENLGKYNNNSNEYKHAKG